MSLKVGLFHVGEFEGLYGNWKKLDRDSQIEVLRNDKNDTEVFEPRLYMVKMGHFIRILFDDYENSESFAKVITGLVHENVVRRYGNHSIEEELSRVYLN